MRRMNKELIDNIDKFHTTQVGGDRIKRNLGLADIDPVEFSRSKILDRNAVQYKWGKNWYVRAAGCILTVSAGNYTIITAHKDKQIAKAEEIGAYKGYICGQMDAYKEMAQHGIEKKF